MSQDFSLQRIGKFQLSRWKFYEDNIHRFEELTPLAIFKKHSTAFFKALAQLEEDEIEYLALRYYKEPTQLYNKWLGVYQTVKPEKYDVLGVQLGLTDKELRELYYPLHVKLGALYTKEEKAFEKERIRQ